MTEPLTEEEQAQLRDFVDQYGFDVQCCDIKAVGRDLARLWATILALRAELDDMLCQDGNTLRAYLSSAEVEIARLEAGTRALLSSAGADRVKVEADAQTLREKIAGYAGVSAENARLLDEIERLEQLAGDRGDKIERFQEVDSRALADSALDEWIRRRTQDLDGPEVFIDELVVDGPRSDVRELIAYAIRQAVGKKENEA